MNHVLAALDTMRAEANAIMAAAHAIATDTGRFERAVKAIANMEPHQRITVTGAGKSYVAAQKIAKTLATCGILADSRHPSDLLHGELGAIRIYDLVIVVSHSGETDELVKLLPHLKRKKCAVLAIVGKADSTLGRLAGTLCTHVKEEPLSLPTLSYAATVAIGDALAVAVATLHNESEDSLRWHHPGGAIGKAARVN